MFDHSRARGRRRACLIAVLFALISPEAMTAQESSPPQPVTIANTERRVLRSAANGIEYEIDVALPRGYATSQKRYPAVYMLDGNVFFPLLTSSYRLAASLIPDELIVVGIGYPAKDYGFWSREYSTSRARDYTTKPATPVGGVSAGAGGAPAFLRFVRDELIPLIDSTYRTVPGDRGIMGHSFGGLFCAYVLTHEPGLFQKYSMGDPSLFWDNESPFRWESEYAATHTELRARVYVYLSREDASIRRFWEALKARHYAGLDLVDFAVVPDEVHTSVIIGSLEHALRKLYARKAVSLPIETLRWYTGRWKVGDEPVWTREPNF
jgi:predicted alpha/beta superfamily hydrolase